MTAQLKEKLIIDGKECSMTFCPPIPLGHSNIIECSEEEISEMMEKDVESFIVSSTACWRAYVATWEIKDGKFYLVDIIGRYRKNNDDPIFAEWFTGVLRIPRGEMIKYVHMGFGSVFEEEQHIKIESGIVIEINTVKTGEKYRLSKVTRGKPPIG